MKANAEMKRLVEQMNEVQNDLFDFTETCRDKIKDLERRYVRAENKLKKANRGRK